MKAFSQTETKELITLAERLTETGAPLTEVFKRFALSSGRAKGSVRNHYYKTIKSNFSRLNLPERLRPSLIVEFTRQEELGLLTHVIKSVTIGKSVRKSVYELACGNEKLALRYLNKYRALVNSKSPLIKQAEELVEKELGNVKSITKTTEKHELKFKKLEREINDMLDRLLKEVVAENNYLKEQTSALKTENERLKSVVKETMRQKNFTKDYFSSFLQRDVK